jgi:hypothetical protein
MVDDFENWEAIRRIQEKKEKFNKHVADLVRRKNECWEYLKILAKKIEEFKTIEWNEAVHDKNLNGLVFVEETKCGENIKLELRNLVEAPGLGYVKQVINILLSFKVLPITEFHLLLQRFGLF